MQLSEAETFSQTRGEKAVQVMQKRLEKAYRDAECILVDRSSKIVCMSDCHRGVGNHGDNFMQNENVFFAALQYYYDRGFSYIELGDGDELWENKNMNRIWETHTDAFEMMEMFERAGRFRMLYGNHDYCKKRGKCFTEQGRKQAQEGILLKDRISGHEILLLHGHQGDLMNDYLWPVTAFLVRFLWRPLELFGVWDPTSAARNYKKQKKTEYRLDHFAKEKGILVLAGHTHRPVLPEPGDSRYFNDGSCVHPRCITAMEFERGCITLVKWHIAVCFGRSLCVERQVMAGPVAWEDYWK